MERRLDVTEEIVVLELRRHQEDEVQRDETELEESMRVLKLLATGYCTDCLPEERPEEFPVELWRWVFSKLVEGSFDHEQNTNKAAG